MTEIVCEPLLKEATPSIYQNNPFSVLSLPTNAPDREIKKRIQEYTVKIRAGMIVPTSGSEYGISEINRLSEIELWLGKPERRLISEFFHFWMNPDLKANLYQKIALGFKWNDPSVTIKQWLKLEKAIRNPQIHIHDLAVLSHRLALCVEKTLMDNFLKRTLREFFWRKTFSFWNRCMQNEDIWSDLRERVRLYQDPRLTTGFIRRFRDTLLPALYAINLHLYIGYRRKKNDCDAEWHRDFLLSIHADSVVMERAFLSSGQFIIDRIEHFNTQLSKPCKNYKLWYEFLEAEYQPIQEPIAIVCEILAEAMPLRTKLLDETAQAIFQYITPFCHQEENYRLAMEWLNKAGAIAVSPLLQERIYTNRNAIQMHLERKPCWFCGDFFSDDRSAFHRILRPGMWNISRYKSALAPETVEIPRCPRCESIHQRQRFMIRLSLCGGFLLGGSTIYLFSSWIHLPAYWTSVLALMIVVMGVGIRNGCEMERWGIPKGVRPESDYLHHPFVERIRDAWRSGQTPLEQIQQKL